jgi:predicted kinase
VTNLVIIRGASGSGKSTYASRHYPGFMHYEADQFFSLSGSYKFNPALLAQAHQWCQLKVETAIIQKHDVVVSNTFIKLWEMQHYLDLAKKYNCEVEVIELYTQYQNVHGVDQPKVNQMRSNFQPYNGATTVF